MVAKAPALFLDRDGVINEDLGYVYRVEDFRWQPGALEAIRLANQRGYLVFVITNQSGIARGFYTTQDFLMLTQWIHDTAKSQHAHISATYHCPHHPTEGNAPYRTSCQCRKPGTALLEQACREWPIDKTRSIMVGDKESDLVCAQNFHIQGELFKGGDLCHFLASILGK